MSFRCAYIKACDMKKILTILLAVVLSAVTINASATDNGGEQGKIDTKA